MRQLEMKVTTGHFSLNAEQRRFEQMLKQCPRLYGFWNFETKDFNSQAAKEQMGALSSGEQILLKFFSSIWLGENTGFDLIDAAKSLDPESLQLINNWLKEPFFP